MQGQDLTPISMLPSCFQHGLAILREDIPELLGMISKANRGCGYFIESPDLLRTLLTEQFQSNIFEELVLLEHGPTCKAFGRGKRLEAL